MEKTREERCSDEIGNVTKTLIGAGYMGNFPYFDCCPMKCLDVRIILRQGAEN